MRYDEPPIPEVVPREGDWARIPGSARERTVPNPNEFRMLFWPYFRFIGPWTAFISCVLCVELFPVGIKPVLVANFAWFAFSIGYFLYCYSLSVATVTSNRLKGYDIWTIAIQIQWTEIKRAKPFNFAGMHYLRIYSSGTWRVMWVPMFLQDKTGFIEAVRRVTEPGNPLRVYLEGLKKSK